ncbi:hypothetical protein IJ118_02115 [Candidatus Saccharibacteria bacterium]|nr:hypothetical protein [Candidatus Saccharibacteria bacterium]
MVKHKIVRVFSVIALVVGAGLMSSVGVFAGSKNIVDGNRVDTSALVATVIVMALATAVMEIVLWKRKRIHKQNESI